MFNFFASCNVSCAPFINCGVTSLPFLSITNLLLFSIFKDCPIISLGIRGVGNPPNCSGQTKIAFPEVNNLSHISL